MKKLFLRIGILLLIVYTICQIAIYSMPFSWGNTRLNTKYQSYKENHEQYNTLLIGASTTYRHINSRAFDSIVNAQYPELNIKSYNFGIPANRTPQSLQMMDELLSYDMTNIKHVVIDMSELTKMGADNLHKKEMLYWYNWGNIGDVMKASYESEKGLNKFGVPVLHAFSFGEKSFLFANGPSLIMQHAGLNIEPTSVGPDKNGFYSLDQEMHDDPEGDLAIRYNELRTQDTIDYRTQRCQQLVEKYKNESKNPNKTIEENLKDVIEFCEKNDITVVIMLSQRLGERYEYLIPLYNQLPEKNRIGFQDPSAYPELNKRENLFDLAHLNEPGSKIFTAIFAEEWLKKLEMQNKVTLKLAPVVEQDILNLNTTADGSGL
jgi:hypothetical protein